MGGKLSKTPENKSHSVSPTYENPHIHGSNNYVPISGAPASPACAPPPSGNGNPPSMNIVAPCLQATTPSTGSVGGLPVTNANPKEAIVFHSSINWSEYFEGSKHSNKLVVIYFTATWCGPCKYLEPTIKDLAAKHTNVDIVKIDVDELYNVSREYGIQAMPTFFFLKNGKEIDKIIGAKKEDLQDKVAKHSKA